MKTAISQFVFSFFYGFTVIGAFGALYNILLGPLDLSNIGHLILFIATVAFIVVSGEVVKQWLFKSKAQ